MEAIEWEQIAMTKVVNCGRETRDFIRELLIIAPRQYGGHQNYAKDDPLLFTSNSVAPRLHKPRSGNLWLPKSWNASAACAQTLTIQRKLTSRGSNGQINGGVPFATDGFWHDSVRRLKGGVRAQPVKDQEMQSRCVCLPMIYTGVKFHYPLPPMRAVVKQK